VRFVAGTRAYGTGHSDDEGVSCACIVKYRDVLIVMLIVVILIVVMLIDAMLIIYHYSG
jgi:hypothetical protein